MFARLHAFLTAPVGKTARATTLFWFWLSLTCALAIALLTVRPAFSHAYVVQDDARQHVFWMQRFIDPGVFPNDVIADYFQSVAPLGYTTLYRALAAVGIAPLLASKLLPIVLVLISTAYCFAACLQILPVPLAGFLASLILNQNLMRADDIYSATPRAFVYPLFLAFLYYLLRRSRLPCAIAVLLLGLFYPQVMLVACGVLLLSLLRWEHWRPRLSTERQDYWLTGAGLLGAAIAVLLYLFQQDASEFGPAISFAQAKQLPEFWGAGRLKFFTPDMPAFWFTEQRSAITPRPNQLFDPRYILLSLLLPGLLRLPQRLPLVQQVTTKVHDLGLILFASVGLYFAAHAVLFKLHLPSRYTQHSLRMVMAIAAGIVLTLLIDGLLRWALSANHSVAKRTIALITLSAIALTLLAFPVLSQPRPRFIVGREPKLYEFFAQQPQDILIASLSTQANFLPSFSQRSILAAEEYGIVYHLGYYQQFRDRMLNLLRAHYSTNPDEVRRFTEKYSIDFWLLDKTAFKAKYFRAKAWIRQHYEPVTSEVIEALKRGTIPVLEQQIDRCTVLETQKHFVLQANCVIHSPNARQ